MRGESFPSPLLRESISLPFPASPRATEKLGLGDNR